MQEGLNLGYIFINLLEGFRFVGFRKFRVIIEIPLITMCVKLSRLMNLMICDSVTFATSTTDEDLIQARS